MPGVDLTCEQSATCSSWNFVQWVWSRSMSPVKTDYPEELVWNWWITPCLGCPEKSVWHWWISPCCGCPEKSEWHWWISPCLGYPEKSVWHWSINPCIGYPEKSVWHSWNYPEESSATWLEQFLAILKNWCDMAGTIPAIAEQDCWGIYRTVKPLETYISPGGLSASEGQGSELCSWRCSVGVGRRWMLLRVKWLDSAYDLWSILPVAHCGSTKKKYKKPDGYLSLVQHWTYIRLWLSLTTQVQ